MTAPRIDLLRGRLPPAEPYIALTTHDRTTMSSGGNGFCEATITSHVMDATYRRQLDKGIEEDDQLSRNAWGLDLDAPKDALTIDAHADWYRRFYPETFEHLRPES